MRGLICNCVALYGAKHSTYNLKGWYEYMLTWFEQCGTSPDMVGVTGQGFSKKALPFAYLNKRLEKKGFQGIESIELYSTVPDYTQLVFGWKLSADLNIKAKTMTVCFDDNSVGFNFSYLKRLVKELSQFYEFQYGICYQREFKKGPALYAYGFTAGLGYDESDMNEKGLISKWLHDSYDKSSYLEGYMRDIYPLNVLSNAHLNKHVGEQPLKEWVLRTSERGTLEQLNESCWIWEVNTRDTANIRCVLGAHRVLICYP